MLSTPAVAGQPITLHIPNASHQLPSHIVLGPETTASEIWLEGEPGAVLGLAAAGANGRRRRLSSGTTSLGGSMPLITILKGAPTVHVSGLRIDGGVRVEGSSLRLHGCTLDGTHATVAGATVVGGSVLLNRTDVTGFASGGMSVTAGRVTIRGAHIHGNGRVATATFGGLVVGDVSIGGGSAHVSVTDTLIEDNGYARDGCDNQVCVRGGALKVVGGKVRLGGGTRLAGNFAFEGNTIYVDVRE